MKLPPWLVGGCMLTVAGCSDPKDSVLPPGSMAVVVGEKGAAAHNERGDFMLKFIPPGTRVTVGHDPGYWQETQEYLDDFLSRREEEAKGKSEELARISEQRKAGPQKHENGSGVSYLRLVKVIIETGEYRGSATSLSRQDLRPAK